MELWCKRSIQSSLGSFTEGSGNNQARPMEPMRVKTIRESLHHCSQGNICSIALPNMKERRNGSQEKKEDSGEAF